MRKFCLAAAGLFLSLFASFAQNTDSTAYKPKKLTFEEANLVTSYYHQDGNNSAVTGGVGTEKLTDYANTIDVKLFKYDRKDRKHTYDLELGVDHYTSASSDMVDLRANSSASHADTRIYPSATWTMENEAKGSTVGAGASLSAEFDYLSLGGNLSFAKKTNDRNGEFSAKVQAYFDQVSYVTPTELRTRGGGGGGEGDDYARNPRNSFSGTLSYSQIVNQRLQLMLIADLVYQSGYLGLPFHRVYWNNATVHIENLPDTRLKIPLGFRANYFLGDKIVLRSFYRYYTDDWGLNSHTAQFETSIKATPFFSITPFYRYYTQTAVKYFAPKFGHTSADTYYTSNYDLSAFNSHFYGAGVRVVPPKGVFGIERLNMLELRYGHYRRSNGLQSNIVSLNLKFK